MVDISAKPETEEKPEFLQLSDVLYHSIVKRFETLFGRGFASKVISFSAYTAAKDLLKNKRATDDLPALLHGTVETMVGGKVIKYKIDKEIGGVVQVKDSLEARAYGPSDAPVCYLTSGTIKAFAEKIVGGPRAVKERRCTAMGDDYCEFVVTANR